MFRKLILLFVYTLSCFSSAVYAVGLGEYNLESGLNQPLKAEIVLLSAGDLSEHEIQASLASLAEFEKVGVERLFFLNDIRFETFRADSGELKVKLSTREPIKEPFLNFLVELNWPNGRIIREYTFLLDPPIFDDSTSSTIQQTQATSRPTTSSPPPQTQVRRTSSPQQQPSYTGSTYGPVSASDTLWSIATKVRPDNSVSIHQTLVAIYRANPDAFANGNINNLLRGKVLEIPDATSIRQVPHRAALQDVVVQNRQWQSGGARRIVDNQETGSTSQMSGEARLSLATPGSGSSDAAANGNSAQLEAARNELARSEEESATLQAENDELRVRLADALKKLETIQETGAVNIENTELAVLSSQAGSEDATDDMTETDSSMTASDEVVDTSGDSNLTAAIDDSGVSDTTSIDSGSVDSAVDDQAAGESTTTSIGTSQDTTTVPAATSTTPQLVVPPKEKGFFETLLESSMLLYGGVAAIILIVVAVFWRMRKRMEEEDFQDDLVASAGIGTDATETFELPDVGDDMLVELDMEDADEEVSEAGDENFDPLGEADIYIAYGKYEQAESLLLEAIDENPIRSDLKVKLMECYAENDDREKFESLAQEVSQAVDADEWNEPISALREQAWTGEGSQLAQSEDDFDLPSTEDIFGDDQFNADDDSDFLSDGVSSDSSASDLDLEAESLDDDEIEEDFSLGDDSSEDEFDIDMDLNLDEETESSSEAVTETFDSIDDEEFAFDEDDDEAISLDDSDLDDSGLDMDESLELDDQDSIDIDDSDDISLDLDDDELDFDSDEEDYDDIGGDSGDEIATKLDLARAYIDMGDAEGAKEILSEVISEGSEAQKQEAQDLMSKAE